MESSCLGYSCPKYNTSDQKLRNKIDGASSLVPSPVKIFWMIASYALRNQSLNAFNNCMKMLRDYFKLRLSHKSLLQNRNDNLVLY
ncbi:unnamed protein product [Oikopleura dioica]|uniref:Uncharacterized protein n=1 Tax=Oikopleura dioica TaxID=34765 RepID=E4Z6A6_OIKDI|nr:unnamed protein product [Oikopleura dioica]